MPQRTKKPAEVEPAEEVEPATNGSRRNVQPRLSITVDQQIRKNIRIAAAIADLDVGQWCVKVLEKAADKQIASDGEDEE